MTECFRKSFSTPLSFSHEKESAVDGRKKEWQRGISISPFAIPLKRPRKGLCPLPWNHPRRNRKISDFHMSNICRAETFPYTKLNAPPAGRFVYARSNDTTQKRNNMVFQARQRDSASSALFFHIFSRKREKIWPAERRYRRGESHRAISASEMRRLMQKSGGFYVFRFPRPSGRQMLPAGL